MARLLSVNVGLPRDIDGSGDLIWREMVKAIWPAMGVNSEPSSSTKSSHIATGRTN